ncbi:CoA transferase [Actinomadura sp. LD22]|uniref:CoA transferase n=1 Tax=Actinomadura physcomitrii TaxID=2650748 RepID=A0A6I4MAK7_9ACTN|nr:CaiB/BaiF CoA-transferase family protein [Actinomadura physcomitrii]MWA03278.1 CoA transferase [Actinomadura physcomitrii]
MDQPLQGVRVIELGHAVAGPMAAGLLADFGADVVKIEQPGVGDSLRRMGPQADGVGVWWSVSARNKRSVAVDFKKPEGLEIVRSLIATADAVVENFRPGVLARAGLGYEDLLKVKPDLVMLSVSGYGQQGPYSRRGGFGKIAEAFSGATHLTGHRNEPPLHPGYSLADMTTGLMGAYGVMLALFERDRSGSGQVIDLALYEPLLRMIEWQLPLADASGTDPLRNGTMFPFDEAFLTDICTTSDGGSVVVSAATTPSIAALRTLLIDSGHLAEDETGSQAIITALRAWCAERGQEAATKALQESNVVAGNVNTASQIIDDPHVERRGSVVRVPMGASERPMPAALPFLSRTPGSVRWSGPALGQHTDEVLTTVLDLTEADIARLRAGEIIQ